MPRESSTAPKVPGDTTHDTEKALAAGANGGAHRVAKHPDPETLPRSPVQGDPDRPADAAVNAKGEMKYDEAMKLLEAGKLKRAVLTERGWLTVPMNPPTMAKV